MRFPVPEVDSLDLSRPGIHILRGPRQVGKSTDLKLLVRRALQEGLPPRRVVYLSLDLFENQPTVELVRTVIRALELADGGTGEAMGSPLVTPRLVLLDEVTSAESWRTAIKVLWDDGAIDADVVVCTGSSAIDLAYGAAERLPGRRGAGRDMLVLPQSFASFARALAPQLPDGLGLTVAEILSDDGRARLLDAHPHLPALRVALERYLLFGGLPAAVAEAASGADGPSEQTLSVLWDSLVREVQRRGASLSATHALIERIARSLGSKLSWSRLARELSVPLGKPTRARGSAVNDPRTVQSYVELLAVNYFAVVLYFWKTDSGSADLAKDKKVYFGDPLLLTIARTRTALPFDAHAAVENALAVALYRRYEPFERRAEGFQSPERLHVWGTAKGGEIDFVCGPRDAIDAVEVADWETVSRQKATAPMRALPGRPALVATRSELRFARTANLVPASLLLWALS